MRTFVQLVLGLGTLVAVTAAFAQDNRPSKILNEAERGPQVEAMAPTEAHFMGETRKEAALKKKIAEIETELAALKGLISQIKQETATAKTEFETHKEDAFKYEALMRMGEVSLAPLQVALRKYQHLNPGAAVDGSYGRDTADAVRAYQQAAGAPPSARDGWPMLENGWLTNKMALDLLCGAATERRDAYTLFHLAKMYFDGRGFVRSYDKARFAARDAQIILEGEINNPFSSAQVIADDKKLLADVEAFLRRPEVANVAKPQSYTNIQLCSIDDLKVALDSVTALEKTRVKIDKSIKNIEDLIRESRQ